MTPPCIVCNGNDFSILVQEGEYRWAECRACGFVRLDREFSLADAEWTEGEDVGRSYIADYQRKFESKMKRTRRRAQRLRRRAPGNNFLDIGSNYGFMVEAATALGFRAIGIEMNPTLVVTARVRFPNRTFLEGAFETVANSLGTQRFDVVYCSEVIEHTPDPRAFLDRIAAVLRSGGLLYLTTPHIREYRKHHSARMGAPDHKHYFNEANVNRLLRECGFAKIRHDFTFFRGIKLWAQRV